MVTQGLDPDRPAEPLDREAIARIEVGHTHVSPLVARVLVGWFLLMLAVLPLIELAGPRRPEVAGAWSHLASVPDGIDRRLSELRLRASGDGEEPGAWRRLVTANRAVLEGMEEFETALEDQSAVGRALRPHVQGALSQGGNFIMPHPNERRSNSEPYRPHN